MLAELRAIVEDDGDDLAGKAVRIADTIRRACGCRWVGIYEVTETEIGVLGWSGPDAPAFPRFPRTQGISGAAVASRETVNVGDVANDPRYLTNLGDTGSELIVPVLVDGEVRGTIDVESDRLHAFDEGQRVRLEECARAIAALWR